MRCLILRSLSHSSGTSSELYTCIGTIAAKSSGGRVASANGWPSGGTETSRSPHSKLLTTIILPAM